MKHQLTRIAPTPSGYLHLGNAYSFLVTKALAQKTGAKILLRIDDLDRERYRPEYVEDIFETLDFLEIPYDQGPKDLREFEKEWSQIHRMGLYSEGLATIQSCGKLFGCICSRKKIQQMNPEGHYLGQCLDRRIPLDKPETSWRMNTLDADFLTFHEYPEKTVTDLIPEETAFYVVRKKDQLPAYQLTSVLDDLHFGVDLIVRGKDLYPSTLAQLDMAKNIQREEFSKITFHHHRLLKSPTNQKLSKSDGATSIQFLRKEGKKLPDIFVLIGQMMGSTEPVASFEGFEHGLGL